LHVFTSARVGDDGRGSIQALILTRSRPTGSFEAGIRHHGWIPAALAFSHEIPQTALAVINHQYVV